MNSKMKITAKTTEELLKLALWYDNSTEYVTDKRPLKIYKESLGKIGYVAEKLRFDKTYKAVYELPSYWHLKRCRDSHVNEAYLRQAEKKFERDCKKWGL